MLDPATGDGGDKFIAEEIAEGLKWSRFGQRAWSFANHSSTICIVIFSATAAVLSQLDDKAQLFGIGPKSAATVLSLAVTIVSTVQAKLGFERKWVANRMTHSAFSQLLIDEKTGASLQDVKEKLKSILDQHDKAITGSASS
jgi:hypothetical protein